MWLGLSLVAADGAEDGTDADLGKGAEDGKGRGKVSTLITAFESSRAGSRAGSRSTDSVGETRMVMV